MQSVCAGSAKTMGLVMLPMYHASTSKETVLNNRRLIEDKVTANLDSYEISIQYADSGHGGDRRKKSQMCP